MPAEGDTLLFDLELEEHSPRDEYLGSCCDCHPSEVPAPHQCSIPAIAEAIKRDLRPHWVLAEQAARLAERPGDVDPLLGLAQCLAGDGYRVWLRSTRGLGSAPRRPEQLKHRFLVIELPGKELLIADPNFWQQFYVAPSSNEFKALLKQLPPVFVGTASDIRAVSSLLCAEVEKAFARLGISCPPWRTKAAMLSRWLVSSAVDHLIEASSDGNMETNEMY